MYDAFTTTYSFSCPTWGETRVRLSGFRQLEQLPGASHPAVYRVDFACPCGESHPGLVSHDDLDWAPLGLADATFVNLMTARTEPVGSEFGDLAARRIQAGEWPWSFFCYPEERTRPVFPSSFRLLSPGARDGLVGVAVRCPDCGKLSVNVVTQQHIDVPFHNDSEVGIVDHVFERDAATLLEEFQEELYSSSFDARRLHFH